MSSKGEILPKFWFRRCILAITILCASVWWASVATLAQETVLGPSKMTACSILCSLDGPRSNTVPNLALGMAEQWDAPSYRSLRYARYEAANSAANPVSRPVGPVADVNRGLKGESGPLVLSSLFAPTGVRGLTDFHAEAKIERQIVRSSPDQAGLTAYSLLDDWPALGSLMDGYRMKYFSSTQGLANSEFSSHQVEHYPVPLVQLKFGDWQLPVVLSSR